MSNETETLFTQWRLAFGAKKPTSLPSFKARSASTERRKELLDRLLGAAPCAERSIEAARKKLRVVSDRTLNNFVVTIFHPETTRQGEIETYTTITLDSSGEILSALISSPSEKSTHEVLAGDVGFLLLQAKLDRTLIVALAH